MEIRNTTGEDIWETGCVGDQFSFMPVEGS